MEPTSEQRGGYEPHLRNFTNTKPLREEHFDDDHSAIAAGALRFPSFSSFLIFLKTPIAFFLFASLRKSPSFASLRTGFFLPWLFAIAPWDPQHTLLRHS